MEDIKGKRALVTGAGRGIGRAIALRLSKLGAKVCGLSKNQTNLDSLKKEDGNIETICVDLSDWDATRRAVQEVLPIHLLVNNAGVLIANPALAATQDEFDSTFSVNVKAIMNVTQVVADDLIKRSLRGNIVNISSLAGTRAYTNNMVYSCSKAAVNMMTKTFALELGPHGIRVNSISPTVIDDTDMGKWIKETPGAQAIKARIPQGKFPEVEHVVNSTIYLLSDRSEMVNGHDILIDGGALVG